ncbi:MAG TPA: hypothetical protein VHW94_06570 [Candidatus Dormibacteraeota bacterium]|nr:hypothetical protein [Candidatus Dormibacteraeota bacterium]
MKGLLSGGASALAVKAATGFAVAVVTILAAAAVTEAAITGSADPSNWGRLVTQQVATCKAALKTGEHGIGQCVSAFAKQHGDTVSDQRASGARLNHGNGNANGSDKATGEATDSGKGNGNGKGRGNGHGQTSHKSDHSTVVTSDGAED